MHVLTNCNVISLSYYSLLLFALIFILNHFLASYFKYLLKLDKGTILLLVRIVVVYSFCVINLFRK